MCASCVYTQSMQMLCGTGVGAVLVPLLQDHVHGSDVDPQLEAAHSQQFTETNSSRSHRRQIKALQGQPVHLSPGPLQPKTQPTRRSMFVFTAPLILPLCSSVGNRANSQ